MKDRFGTDGEVISIDRLMEIADAIDQDTAAFLGCSVEDLNYENPILKAMDSETIEVDGYWTEDEEDTMICERHGVSLHIHECEGFDF